ncbi:uncharacterized protein LOC132547220 [Ylistrum balloti]|uniref:uncharacterized protein LOC132547220 n=1 Tax=Ylistrum balloti TaxID=509963 RepID=UPI002905A2A1|nr:uncharacterized protein LOC132547220 [Ylistrum balloti]
MLVSTIKVKMQMALTLLVVVTVHLTQYTNSLPTKNRKDLEIDLRAICNANCTSDTCYTPSPDACHHYIFCYKYANHETYSLTHLYTCPLGQIWHPTMLTCLRREDMDSYGHSCTDSTLKSYRHGSYCSQYYECVDGKSIPSCCRRGEAFINEKCVPNKDCKWSCPDQYAPVETTTDSGENITTSLPPETTTEVCTKSAVTNNNQKYIVHDANSDIEADCARGTIYDQAQCNCITDPNYVPSTECFPEKVINYATKSVARNDVWKDYEVRNVNGVGIFSSKDKSSNKVNHYNGNSNLLKHFNMTVIFKSESTGDKTQFLVTNCRSTQVDRPSLGIMVSNIDENLLFVADDNATAPYDSIIKMTVKFKQGSWNWVRYIFNGRTLEATVVPLPDRMADPSTITEVFTKNVTLAIELLSSQNPLTFGYCNNQGFDGLIYMANIAPWVCSMYVDSKNGI